jgi:hypothetical protein
MPSSYAVTLLPIGVTPDTVAMQNAAPTSSASVIDGRTLDAAQEDSREQALTIAAQRELPVREVREIQKQQFYVLLTGVSADGVGWTATSTTDGRGVIPPELAQEVDSRVESDHDETMQSISETPDAIVFKRDGAMAGYEQDQTREVGLAEDVVADPELAKRVSVHEGAHVDQEPGDLEADLPETGVAILDEQPTISRTEDREFLAVEAEGGLQDHTPEYAMYVARAKAKAAFLDRQGFDGNRLVQESGNTVQGFRNMHAALVQAAMKKHMKEQGIPAFSSN